MLRTLLLVPRYPAPISSRLKAWPPIKRRVTSVAQRAAGRAHLRATLSGHLQYPESAEYDLAQALEHRPNNQHIATTLARLLNMRSTVMDLSKAELQRDLYQRTVDHSDSQRAFHMFALHSSADAGLIVLARQAPWEIAEGHHVRR